MGTNNRINNNNYGAARNQGDILISSCVPIFNPDGTPQLNGQGHPPPGQQPHSSVSVKENYFYQLSKQAAVSATGVAGLTISLNQVEWVASQPPALNFNTPDSSGLDVANNRC